MREDRSVIWYALTEREGLPEPEAQPAWPLAVAQPCDGGWAHGGVDLIAARTADRLDCPTDGSSYWIDRDLGIVVRSQSPADERYGTDVIELVALRLAAQPSELFVLPDDAVVVDQ